MLYRHRIDKDDGTDIRSEVTDLSIQLCVWDDKHEYLIPQYTKDKVPIMHSVSKLCCEGRLIWEKP